MHLKNRPVYFVKDGNRRAVYYSVDARELTEAGWTVEQDAVVAPLEAEETQPELAQVEVPVAEPVEATESAEAVKPNLDSMTRAELVEFADANDIEFKSNAPKADILEACKEFAND